MLNIKSAGGITEILRYICDVHNWNLTDSEGLRALEKRLSDKEYRNTLFEECNSFQELLDVLIIKNGFAYFVERPYHDKVTLTIVGDKDVKSPYRIQYFSAQEKKSKHINSPTVVHPYAHLQQPLSGQLRSRNLKLFPTIGVEQESEASHTFLSIRALSVQSIRPNSGQIGKSGGIINMAREMAVIDENGSITWKDTMFFADILQTKVIWVDTRHMYPHVAASKALGMTADEFRSLGWVVRRVVNAKEKSVKQPMIGKLSPADSLGFDCTVNMVGFPYAASHDVVYLRGVHDRFELRRWRMLNWQHTYSSKKGWFTTMALGT